jgi:hypothetical protein
MTTTILVCRDCGYTANPQRLNNHIFYAHGRHQLGDDELTPVKEHTAMSTSTIEADDE